VGLQHVASVGWTSWCGVAIEVLFSCGAMNAITDGVLFTLPDALPEHLEEHELRHKRTKGEPLDQFLYNNYCHVLHFANLLIPLNVSM